MRSLNGFDGERGQGHLLGTDMQKNWTIRQKGDGHGAGSSAMTTKHDGPHLSPLDLLLREVLVPHAPKSMKDALRDAVPIMTLMAHQLGMEILVAESMSMPFIDAVERPDCLKMARVYFGAMNLLQQELPPEFRRVFRRVLNDAAQGTFEPTRKILFIAATRVHDPEAAVCRFLLWIAIQLNLKIQSWDKPGVEARGTLAEMARVGEEKLRSLLGSVDEDWLQDDFRPLNVLVTEALLHAVQHDESVQAALIEFSGGLEELVTQAEGIELHRRLDARTAVVVDPSSSKTQMGSQRLVDRYPQHFTSANAMEKHRSRLRECPQKAAGAENRLIDIIKDFTGDSQ